jgi:hypothetical protein
MKIELLKIYNTKIIGVCSADVLDRDTHILNAAVDSHEALPKYVTEDQECGCNATL